MSQNLSSAAVVIGALRVNNVIVFLSSKGCTNNFSGVKNGDFHSLGLNYASRGRPCQSSECIAEF